MIRRRIIAVCTQTKETRLCTYVRTYLHTWMLGQGGRRGSEGVAEEGEIRATNVTRRQSPTREE